MIDYPTAWQKKTLWTAISLVAMTIIGAFFVFIILLGREVISFLQPLLVPIAVAAILAYLLEPVVRKLCRWRIPRTWAVVLVFGMFILAGAIAAVIIIPVVRVQFGQLIGDLANPQTGLPAKIEEWRTWGLSLLATYHAKFDDAPFVASVNEWVMQHWPDWAQRTSGWLLGGLPGFLGGLGILLSLVLVPLFLFVFLKNTDSISRNWGNYLPVRASRFRDELVAVLTEVNGYLANFFRGQVVVSFIDGLLTGLALAIFVQLKYSLLIGLMVAVLGIIPYIGIVLSWAPAVLVAAVQFKGDWWPPVVVTIIFLLIQNIDGIFIAPKIIGESVGLHPLTVIVSVIGWGLLIGGILGALLAVPLTAIVKVLMNRYVWTRNDGTAIQESPRDPVEEASDRLANVAAESKT
jgi:predicted PurR-regulated permease PerM